MIFQKQVREEKYYDIIVAGGGVAGVAAALTAAKTGKSVLLLEKTTVLGGLATGGLINFFVPMCNGRGKQIIFGLAEELLRDSIRYGYNTLPKEWKDGEPKEKTEVRYITKYSADIFALVLTEKVTSAGIDLLFDCIAAEPVMEGGHIKGVITESKSGLLYYPCGVLIDATGDADILRRGGVPTAERGNFFTYMGLAITLDSCKKAVEEQDIGRATMWTTGGGINLFGDNQPADVPLWHGTDVYSVSDYLIRNQKVMFDKVKTYNGCDIVQLPTIPQLRTSCHIQGNYTLTAGDAYRHHADSICAINDFEHRDHLFEVPYGCLCREGFDNVLTAGRCASGDGYGWDLLRVIPPAILTGQAAGEAAAMAIENGGQDVNRVAVPELQKRLEKQNMMIHFPDEYVPEDKTVIIHGKNQDGHAEGHL